MASFAARWNTLAGGSRVVHRIATMLLGQHTRLRATANHGAMYAPVPRGWLGRLGDRLRIVRASLSMSVSNRLHSRSPTPWNTRHPIIAMDASLVPASKTLAAPDTDRCSSTDTFQSTRMALEALAARLHTESPAMHTGASTTTTTTTTTTTSARLASDSRASSSTQPQPIVSLSTQDVALLRTAYHRHGAASIAAFVEHYVMHTPVRSSWQRSATARCQVAGSVLRHAFGDVCVIVPSIVATLLGSVYGHGNEAAAAATTTGVWEWRMVIALLRAVLQDSTALEAARFFVTLREQVENSAPASAPAPAPAPPASTTTTTSTTTTAAAAAANTTTAAPASADVDNTSLQQSTRGTTPILFRTYAPAVLGIGPWLSGISIRAFTRRIGGSIVSSSGSDSGSFNASTAPSMTTTTTTSISVLETDETASAPLPSQVDGTYLPEQQTVGLGLTLCSRLLGPRIEYPKQSLDSAIEMAQCDGGMASRFDRKAGRELTMKAALPRGRRWTHFEWGSVAAHSLPVRCIEDVCTLVQHLVTSGNLWWAPERYAIRIESRTDETSITRAPALEQQLDMLSGALTVPSLEWPYWRKAYFSRWLIHKWGSFLAQRYAYTHSHIVRGHPSFPLSHAHCV